MHILELSLVQVLSKYLGYLEEWFRLLYFIQLFTSNAIDSLFLFSDSVYKQETSQGIIRVHAPQFSKISMALQLTEDLQACDVLTRFLSQDR